MDAEGAVRPARVEPGEPELGVRLTLARRLEPVPPSITERADGIAGDLSESLWAHTTTHDQVFAIASEEFGAVRERLRTLLTTDLPALEQQMEKTGAPWTPGRTP